MTNSTRRNFITTTLFSITALKLNISFSAPLSTTDTLIKSVVNKAINVNLNPNNLKVFNSKITSTQEDQTIEFQSEISKLTDNTIYIVSPGTYKIKNIIFPNLKNVVLFFDKVTFKLTENTSPLDHEMIRFNSLVNSVVYNLKTDGNRNNAIDTSLDDYRWYGRCLNWRLGDNSQNVYFLNTTMINSLYCGSQWGKNINNVIMDTVIYDNIGEHVFYISGNGGGNTKNITFKNIMGGSLGINPRNRIKKHETFFLKSSQTIGPNDNFTIENAIFSPTKRASYANIIICTGDLTTLSLKNITLNGNVDAVIYPYNQTSYVNMDNIIMTTDNAQTRLIYSYVKNVKIKEWRASDIDLSKSNAVQQYMQIFTEIKNSSFNKIYFTELKQQTFSTSLHKTTFTKVKFKNSIQGNNINSQINFDNCDYNINEALKKRVTFNNEQHYKFPKNVLIQNVGNNLVTIIPQH